MVVLNRIYTRTGDDGTTACPFFLKNSKKLARISEVVIAFNLASRFIIFTYLHQYPSQSLTPSQSLRPFVSERP